MAAREGRRERGPSVVTKIFARLKVLQSRQGGLIRATSDFSAFIRSARSTGPASLRPHVSISSPFAGCLLIAIPHLLRSAAFWSSVMNASLLVLSFASLAAAPQDVLYDFYSTSCGPCQMMMPIVERLHAEGYPVVKINISERPDLAQRFGVQVIPTFVLVIGGREQQRITGMQDESTLRNMLAQIPQRTPRNPERVEHPRVGKALSVRLADDETKPKWDFHLPLPPFASKKKEMVQVDPPSSGAAASATPASQTRPTDLLADGGDASAMGNRAEPGIGPDPRLTADPDSVVRGAAPRSTGEADPRPASSAVPMLASSARIRVTDEGGVYFGSGVVIDGTAGKSIVLTCGHILRDVKPGSQIEVDLFGGKNFHTYRGSIVKFDLDADVGLLMLQTTSDVTASPVAGAEDILTRGQTVLSIGCSRGELPSIERLRVTTLNRYEGPDTIECTGVPVKGRSGGGLFATNGHVVGVCTNADPQENRGVYAGLKPIHQLLRSAGMEELIPGASRPSRGRLADVAAAPARPALEDPAPTKLELEVAQLKQPPKRPAAEQVVADTPARPEEDVAARAEDAEVICIIRPVGRAGASKVVIINRASRKFMRYLTGESKDQQQPTMTQTEPADAAAALPDAGAPQSGDSVAARSAWKPTGSATRLPR
jgi:thiol-disulfide isomerase/thioredoxin